MNLIGAQTLGASFRYRATTADRFADHGNPSAIDGVHIDAKLVLGPLVDVSAEHRRDVALADGLEREVVDWKEAKAGRQIVGGLAARRQTPTIDDVAGDAFRYVEDRIEKRGVWQQCHGFRAIEIEQGGPLPTRGDRQAPFALARRAQQDAAVSLDDVADDHVA